MSFSQSTVEDLLVQSRRCCSLCHRYTGGKIEIHHIVPVSEGGSGSPDNGIPLCFDCHAEVHAFDHGNPRGRRFTSKELRRRRDDWFRVADSIPVTQTPQLAAATRPAIVIEHLRVNKLRYLLLSGWVRPTACFSVVNPSDNSILVHEISAHLLQGAEVVLGAEYVRTGIECDLNLIADEDMVDEYFAIPQGTIYGRDCVEVLKPKESKGFKCRFKGDNYRALITLSVGFHNINDATFNQRVLADKMLFLQLPSWRAIMASRSGGFYHTGPTGPACELMDIDRVTSLLSTVEEYSRTVDFWAMGVARFIRLGHRAEAEVSSRLVSQIVRIVELADSYQHTDSLVDALRLIRGEDRGSEAAAYL